MKIVSWNVNSLSVRLLQLLDWAEQNHPDIICLQETKTTDEKFPLAEIKAAGFEAVFAGQKAYNGVAILSRHKFADVTIDLPNFSDQPKRLLAVTINNLRMVNVYVPNGQSVGADKYIYKLNWLHALRDYLHEQLITYPQLVIVGDFNIAPEDQDVHDPKAWEGSVLVSEEERTLLHEIMQLGLHDTFRLFNQPPQTFSWWDYRTNALRRNAGLRLDLILASEALSKKCTSSKIDKLARSSERPSDHAPVLAEFDLS